MKENKFDWVHIHITSDYNFSDDFLQLIIEIPYVTFFTNQINSNLIDIIYNIDYMFVENIDNVNKIKDFFYYDALLWNLNILTIAIFLGFKEAFPKKENNDLKRLFIASKDLLQVSNNPDALIIHSYQFKNTMSFWMEVLNFQPDWIHIQYDENTPWYETFVELKRRLPNTIITSQQDVLNCDYIIQSDNNEWKSQDNLKILKEKIALSKKVDLTIALGTFNRLNKLKVAIGSIFSSCNDDCNFEIIINDAGSTDGTIKWLQDLELKNSNVRVIYSGKKTSFTQSFNECLNIANGTYIIWFSDDFKVVSNGLSLMVKHMKTLSPISIGAFYIRDELDISSNNFSIELSLIRTECNIISSRVGCINTKTLKNIFGFNIDFPYYTQDTELIYRILKMGGSVIPCSNANIIHFTENDELKKGNLQKHNLQQYTLKYRTISSTQQERQISNFIFPKILFNINNSSKETIDKVLLNIRKHFINTTFFIKNNNNNYFNPYAWKVFLIKNKNFDIIINIDNNLIYINYPYDNISFLNNIMEG